MDETMDRINQLATERHMLYRQAAKGGLTSDQRSRLQELDSRLPMLWDEYRRELAANSRPVRRAEMTYLPAA